MKNALTIITFLFLLFAVSCTGSKTTADSKESERPNRSELSGDRSAFDLVDYLVRLPGVYVQGGGNNVSVTIRGPNSFMFSTEPLFVVNGQILGRSFYRAKTAVEMHEIERVRVLKGNDAAIYGFQGANGVIVIQTKGRTNDPMLD
jgi:TonB-dependent SusC/RagA subfamily outer membrane receptor